MRYAVRFACTTLLLLAPFAYFNDGIVAQQSQISEQAQNLVKADDGRINLKSAYSVEETGDRLENILDERGLQIFNRIDHAAGAASVDLALRPTELILFGNPQVGTPLMQCDPTVGLALPQKMLIWEDEIGQVWLTYNRPEVLSSQYNLSQCEQAMESLETVSGALRQIAIATVES